jgi:L-aspartate oxidase
VVSHSIIFESKRTGSDEFYIDISHKDPEFVKNRFPMIYKNLLEAGYDMTKEPVPIFPCHHYLMGGINVDTFARTNIKGLYACGECSHTGVHGNNRLASNSLLEALVFSRHAAAHIAACAESVPKDFAEHKFDSHEDKPVIPKGIRTEVRKIMQESAFVIPDKEAAVRGFERVKELRKLIHSEDYCVNRDYVEANSLITIAYLILREII